MRALLTGCLAATLLTGCAQDASSVLPVAQAQPVASPTVAQRLDHVVVIYMENRSFDSLYGLFPGVNGVNVKPVEQRDLSGALYPILPQPTRGGVADPRFPANLPVAPFNMDPYVPAANQAAESTGIPTHLFYQEQEQINGGTLDHFIAWGDQNSTGAPVANGLVLGFYDARTLGLGPLAQQYTLCDNFFHSAFGGSFLNHQWLVAARTPVYQVTSTDPAPPANQVAQLDAKGHIIGNFSAICTPDGFTVNTCFSTQLPPPGAPASVLIPPQIYDCIGDRLNEKGVNWAWYSEGWDAALSGHPSEYFQWHHQPFAYFKNFAPTSPQGREHLRDLNDLEADLRENRPLRPVSFVKFAPPFNEHPGLSDVAASEAKAAELIQRIMRHPDFASTAVIVTYDENGGFYDHVVPPVVDRWGPGTRVPTIIVSPLARRGVDKHPYETASILKLLEERWGLRPLTSRDSAAPSLSSAFQL